MTKETNGADGLGVPVGGTTGQVLTKKSDANNDAEWKTVEDILSDTTKILDVTDSKYKTRVRAYKNGKNIQLTFYQTSWGEEMSSGQKDYLLATLPEGARPLEDFVKKIITSTGKSITIRINATGTVKFSYNYQTISADSTEQIAEVVTFLAK